MAHSSRGWTGARTPSSIKRVRQTTRRRAINQPRRTAAKTLVGKALTEAGNGNESQAQEALTRALSALDKAAKTGAIHRNAADRRKSRLALKVAATLAGEAIVATGKAGRSTGKAAAAKQAKARIAASKASKAKGAQTSVGRAREALARTSRGAADASTDQPVETTPTKVAAPKAAAKASTKPSTKKPSAKASATKPAAKASPAKAAAKASSSAKPAAKASPAKAAKPAPKASKKS